MVFPGGHRLSAVHQSVWAAVAGSPAPVGLSRSVARCRRASSVVSLVLSLHPASSWRGGPHPAQPPPLASRSGCVGDPQRPSDLRTGAPSGRCEGDTPRDGGARARQHRRKDDQPPLTASGQAGTMAAERQLQRREPRTTHRQIGDQRGRQGERDESGEV